MELFLIAWVIASLLIVIKTKNAIHIIGGGFIIVIVLFAVGAPVYQWFYPSEQELAKTKAEQELCRQELSCWAEKKFFTASSACQNEIEKLPKYDFKWTDSTLESKFSHYRWLSSQAGTVTYIGDKLKAQNGFGAWLNISYECDYDPINGAVLSVRVK